jgi:cobalt-zinc-cadmium efflux system outer membrane protein
MVRRPARSLMMSLAIGLGVAGCAGVQTGSPMELARAAKVPVVNDANVARTNAEAAATMVGEGETLGAAEVLPPKVDPQLQAPQPLGFFVAWALRENPLVQAARMNVVANQNRIPQAVALDDPILSNSIFPIPSVAPQYSLMGYMPYGVLLAQQFPWCGTLRLRGEAAAEDVTIALQELAATELDVVAAVKRSYQDLKFAERTVQLLKRNRGLAEEFLELARQRYRLGTATQVDVLRAEASLAEIDRELETAGQGVSEARSELARLLHIDPETPLQTAPEPPRRSIPLELDRLSRLAVAARPELKGRLAAIEREHKGVELARKRFFPSVTLGLLYQNMERTNAEMPETAGGMPNVGFFVGLNLPVYRTKLRAAVREAEARVAAETHLLEAESDQARREVKDLFVQARVQQKLLELLERTNLPVARQVLDLTAGDYRSGAAGVDALSFLGAWRELLQVELQVAQLEAELEKTLASLERAVGLELNQHPPIPDSLPVAPFDGTEASPILPPQSPDSPPRNEIEAAPLQEPPPAARIVTPPPPGRSSPFRDRDRSAGP